MIPTAEVSGLRYPTEDETKLYWRFHIEDEDCKDEHCTVLQRVSDNTILLTCRCGLRTEIPYIKDEEWEDTVNRWNEAKENHREWE